MNSSTLREQIETILEEMDVVDAISYVSIYKKISMIPLAKKSIRFNFLQNYPVISYLVGLSIKHDYKQKAYPDENKITILLNLLEKYFEELGKDFADSIKKNEADNDKRFLKFLVGMHYIVTQDAPETFEFQTAEILQNLYSKFNDYFFNKLGFSVDDAVFFYQKIKLLHDRLLNSRINDLKKLRTSSEDLKNPDKITPNHEEVKKAVSILFKNARDPYFFDVVEFSQKESIHNVERFEKYLTTLSCKFGDGKPEYDSPFEENPFIIKPVINLGDNKFFFPEPEALFYNLPAIFENSIKNGDSKISSKFYKNRSKFLEDKINEYMKRVFPPDSTHKNCSYFFQGKPGETDTIIEFDNKILIIEAKGGMVSLASKRGAMPSLQTDLEDIVKKAHEQGKKTMDYIKSTGIAVFVKGDGTRLEIKYRPGITQFYLLNVTLEPLFTLATNPELLKSLKLFENDEYLWSVNLSDFDIITRQISIPSIFLHYMRQRMKAITSESFFAGNELAFLSYYFKIGNFNRLPKDISPKTKMGLPAELVSEFTNHYTRGTKSPKFELEPEVLQMIQILESEKPENYTNCVFLILDLDFEMRQKMADGIKKITEHSLVDGNPHDFKLVIKGLDLGLSFVVLPKDATNHHDYVSKAKLRKYQSEVTRWLCIVRTLTNDKPSPDLFVYFEYPFKKIKGYEKLSKLYPTKT